MSFDVIATEKSVVKMWTRGVPVEEGAVNQIRNIANMPFSKGVAVMPDVHVGMGATVGTVMATKGAIIPAAVGVDIGCGMMATKTSLRAFDLPDNLSAIRSAIEQAVPHGRTDNGGPNDRGSWKIVPKDVEALWNDRFLKGLTRFAEFHPLFLKPHTRTVNHLGTLGTGNHFIELCLDENDDVWIMLHSGSRGIGNRIGTYFIELAKKDMERWFINLPDKDLSYFPEGSIVFRHYLLAVEWAQDFAKANRHCMMSQTIKAIKSAIGRDFDSGLETAVNCHHNYVATENHFGANLLITRKGAVRARNGDLGIIPGSMGAKSFIVEGKGNPDSFCSCSHGAGRKMSRTQARANISVEEHIRATAGVECRKDADVVDESPAAYKDIDAVMEAQKDLVTIKHTLRQVVCVKG